MKTAVAAWIVAVAVGEASAAEFGWARIRASARGEPYGAVTFRPFSSGRGAIVPLWAQLADLAFRVPPEEREKVAAAPSPAGGATAPAPASLAEDEETPRLSAPVPLYVEPDRSVWPGGSARPPSDDALRTSGENATRGGVEDPGSDVVVTP